jgi:hypothetical protein
MERPKGTAIQPAAEAHVIKCRLRYARPAKAPGRGACVYRWIGAFTSARRMRDPRRFALATRSKLSAPSWPITDSASSLSLCSALSGDIGSLTRFFQFSPPCPCFPPGGLAGIRLDVRSAPSKFWLSVYFTTRCLHPSPGPCPSGGVKRPSTHLPRSRFARRGYTRAACADGSL